MKPFLILTLIPQTPPLTESNFLYLRLYALLFPSENWEQVFQALFLIILPHNASHLLMHQYILIKSLYVQVLIHIWLFVTPWTVTHQAPLPVEFSRQEYWSRVPFPSPGHVPNPGTEPTSLAPLELAGLFFTTEPHGKPHESYTLY